MREVGRGACWMRGAAAWYAGELLIVWLPFTVNCESRRCAGMSWLFRL